MKIKEWDKPKRVRLAGWLRWVNDTYRPTSPDELLIVAEREAATEVNTDGEHAAMGAVMLEAVDDWDGLKTAARWLVKQPQSLLVKVKLSFCGAGGPPNYIHVEAGEVVHSVHLSELDQEHRKALSRAQKRAGSDLIVPFRRGAFVHWGILGKDLEAV